MIIITGGTGMQGHSFVHAQSMREGYVFRKKLKKHAEEK
jgi:hypothetical protein